jgi:ATP-dependent 26S proteasome regulatory subunit
MFRRHNPAWPPSTLRPLLLLACAVLLTSLLGYGCRRNAHTSDSRLQKIDEMLNSQLPPGTPMSRVDHFLKSRGYIVEDSPDKNSLVAVVRHVDTDTLQPATARVTFHFDSNANLISYELQSAPDAPLRP